MEKRRRERTAKRITCSVESGIRRATGIVHNFSEHGIFIQTNFSAPENSLVEIAFATPSGTDEIRIEAGVARKRIVPRQLQRSVPSGLGLEIIPPRTEYERLIHDLDLRARQGSNDSSTSSRGASPPDGMIHTFRFKMVRHDRPGSQVLTIQCATEAGARARAVARLGRGWKVAEAQRL